MVYSFEKLVSQTLLRILQGSSLLVSPIKLLKPLYPNTLTHILLVETFFGSDKLLTPPFLPSSSPFLPPSPQANPSLSLPFFYIRTAKAACMQRRYPATPICSLSCCRPGRIQIWPPCPASCPWTWCRPAVLRPPKRSSPPSRRCAVLAPAAVGAAAAGDVRRIAR
jgi:hypothetical protein